MRLTIPLFALLSFGCAGLRPHFVASPDGTPAAPVPRAPGDDSVTHETRPRFAWWLAPGSDGARLEICADRECRESLATYDVTGTHATSPRSFATGTLYWRVRGRHGDQLGTQASAARALSIESRVTVESKRLTLEAPLEEKRSAERLVALADRALERFSTVLGRPLPQRKLFAAFYGTPAGYRAASDQLAHGRFRNHGGFSNLDASHIRWSPSRRAGVDAPGWAESVLLHELSHQLQLRQLTGYTRQPGWLIEGFSDVIAERTLGELYGIDSQRMPEFAYKLERCRTLIEQRQWIPLGDFLDRGADGWRSDDESAHRRYYAESYCLVRFLETSDEAQSARFHELIKVVSGVSELAVPTRVRRAFARIIGDPAALDARIATWVRAQSPALWRPLRGELRPLPNDGLLLDAGAGYAEVLNERAPAATRHVALQFETLHDAESLDVVLGWTPRTAWRVRIGRDGLLTVLRCAPRCMTIGRSTASMIKDRPLHHLAVNAGDRQLHIEVDGDTLEVPWIRPTTGQIGLGVGQGYAILRSLELSVPEGQATP